jgi:hypothetical protein
VLTNAGNVVRKGRLGPGQMVCADLATGVFQENTEIAREVAAGAPYGEWLKASPRLADLGASGFPDAPTLAPADALRLQSATGMGAEDAAMVVESMAANGVEPTYCMGDDAPLAVLSGRPHPLADYFNQRFAQVTNPAIDPLREGLVMSLESRLGARGNLLAPGPGAYRQVRLESPILLESELEAVQAAGVLTVETFSLHRAGGALAGAASTTLSVRPAGGHATSDGLPRVPGVHGNGAVGALKALSLRLLDERRRSVLQLRATRGGHHHRPPAAGHPSDRQQPPHARHRSLTGEQAADILAAIGGEDGQQQPRRLSRKVARQAVDFDALFGEPRDGFVHAPAHRR